MKKYIIKKDGEYMLVDLHAHSSGISKCCRIDGREVLLIAKEKEIDGIVLTNHYQKEYVTDGNLEFAKRYVEEFEYVKNIGIELGLKVFFGIEVTLAKHSNIHVLVYGINENFVLKYSDLFDYSLSELYKLVNDNGGILVQAHPFRGENRLLNLNYLNGIEVNCHPLYNGTFYLTIADIAQKHKKLITCGGDFHADTYRPKCGVYFPDDIKTIQEIVQYLKEEKNIEICVQEVDGSAPFTYRYLKKN